MANIVETRGRTLEETAALFDGEQPPQDLAAMGGEAATTGMDRAEYARRPSAADSKVLPPDDAEDSADIDDVDPEKACTGEFLEVRPASVHGSSVEELSVNDAPMDPEMCDGRRMYSVDEPARDV